MPVAAAEVLSSGETPNSNFHQGKSSIHGIWSIEPKLRAALYDDENGFISLNMSVIEEKTGIKREYFVYVIAAVTALYLMSGAEAGLLCNMIGVIYPINAAIKVLREGNTKDALLWLPFWVQYGALLLIDSYADLIMRIFPIYWLVKTIILLYLLFPQTRGARRVHKKISTPIFIAFRDAIATKTH